MAATTAGDDRGDFRLPEIKICSRQQAGHLFLSREPTYWRYVISIGDPAGGLPDGYGHLRVPKLRLEFDDVANPDRAYDGDVLPDAGHIKQIIAFSRTVKERVLIHCFAGISRSGAAACILAAANLGPGYEQKAFEHVKSLKADVWPNELMIKLADDILGCAGRLIEAREEVFVKPAMRSDFHD